MYTICLDKLGNYFVKRSDCYVTFLTKNNEEYISTDIHLRAVLNLLKYKHILVQGDLPNHQEICSFKDKNNIIDECPELFV